MVISSCKKLFLISSLFTAGVLISCQKEVDIDPDNPPPVPDEIKDSTLLIKSITKIFYENASGLPVDSITEYYFYDTVNRKITISWDGDGPRTGSEGDEILTYNSSGLLSQINNNYARPGSSDISSINFTYDEEDVLQKIEAKHSNGNIETQFFNKVNIDSANYQLNWKTPDYFPGQTDSAKVGVVFDRTGRFISQIRAYPGFTVDSNGNSVYGYNRLTKDSLVYDANGSLKKIMRNDINTVSGFDHKYTDFEFTSRQIKGDQLYNQRCLILNGIANIPFGDEFYGFYELVGIITILLTTDIPRDLEYFQYLKYPFISARVYAWGDDEYEDMYANSDFDSKGRLVAFTTDLTHFGTKYRIAYYK